MKHSLSGTLYFGLKKVPLAGSKLHILISPSRGICSFQCTLERDLENCIPVTNYLFPVIYFSKSSKPIIFQQAIIVYEFMSKIPNVFRGISVLKTFTNSTGNTCAGVCYFHKIARCRATTLFKKRLRHRYFPLNLAKIFQKVISYLKYIKHTG